MTEPEELLGGVNGTGVQRVRFSRRRLLRVLALAGAGGLLAACTPAAAPSPTAPPAAPTAAPKPAAPTSAPAAAVPTTAPASTSGTGSLTQIKYGATIGGLGDWESYVAADKGFFADNGLQVDQSFLTTTDIATAVASGRLDMGVISVPAVITAVKVGQPIRWLMASQIATPQGKYNNWWCALPDSPITKTTDLIGKKIDILAPNTLAQLTTQALLRKAGMDPSQYDEVSLTFPESYSSLKTKRVDAALFIEPFFTNSNALSTQEYGKPMKVVYTYLDLFPTGLNLACIGANPDWVKSNMDAARRFVKAELQAGVWGGQNPVEMKQIIAKYAQVPYDNIKDMIPAEMSPDGRPIPGFLNQLQQFIIAEKTIPGLTTPFPDDQLVLSGVLPS